MQPSTKRAMLLMVGIVVLVLLLGTAYVIYQISQIAPSVPQVPLKNPSIGMSLLAQNLLFFNNSKNVIPYVLVKYAYTNITSMYLNATIFLEPAQRQIYIVNATGDCYDCGNVQLLTAAIKQDLVKFGLIQSADQVHMVEDYNLTSVAPNSTLIVFNGYMPVQFFQNVSSANNETVMQYLFNRGTAIIYVGDNFSYSLQEGPIGYAQVPTPSVPTYLLTAARTKYKPKNFTGFYFDKPLYYFDTQINSTGKFPIYGPTSYIQVDNGSLVAFPNFISSWNSYQNASADIAKAAAELFWLPKVSIGIADIGIKNRSASGVEGMLLNIPKPNYTTNITSEINDGYGRITAYTNRSFLAGDNGSIFAYVYFKPDIKLNGTLGVANSVIPGSLTNVTGSIFGRKGVSQNIGTSIYVYGLNQSLLGSPTRGPFVPATGNFSFVLPMTFYLSQGNYIATLSSFYGVQYASALIQVKNLSITSPIHNFKNNTFSFYLTSSNTPLDNVNYSITLNRKYGQSGTITNGTINYQLPQGTQELYGYLNFSIQTLNHNFTILMYSPPVQYLNSETSKILYLVIVCCAVAIMIVLVKAPNRDDFFIDIPVISKQPRITLSVTPQQVLEVFDKQNAYFSWKFMPLSRNELRSAIASNIKDKGSAVNLTMQNIEVLLGQLVGNGYLETVDNLYAPKNWMEKSGYDMKYLATFKKIRIYLVTNGYVFTDIGASSIADIVATHLNDKKYINIYSKTSKFIRMPVFPETRIYLAFLNAYEMELFNNKLFSTFDEETTKLKMYIDAGQIRLLDADDPSEILR